MYPEKEIPHKTSWPFRHKGEYEGDTDENNRNTDDSQSENDYFLRNLDKEQEYKWYDECKEYYYIVNKTNEFKISEYKL